MIIRKGANSNGERSFVSISTGIPHNPRPRTERGKRRQKLREQKQESK